jgi:hypothetical protein
LIKAHKNTIFIGSPLSNKGYLMKSIGSLHSVEVINAQKAAMVSPEKTPTLPVTVGQAVITPYSEQTPITLPLKAQQENYTLLTLNKSQSPTGTPQAFLEKKAAEVSQPKQVSQKVEELEDSEDPDFEEDLVIERHTRSFLSYYLTNKEKALDYLSQHKDYIDLDYNNGAIMYLAAEKRDIEMIKFLFGKVAHEGLLRGLEVSAYDGDIECTKLFMDFLDQHDIDYTSIKKTTAYNNHSHIKDMIIERIGAREPVRVIAKAKPSSIA